ncbi:alpha/beta fold hydrolase [Amycolatopsis alkalitolerans]|uniref:Alpha/beta hydrolase n=1 Tax=Amycolatopsis alkalitolerans TaxID=2547244 RepID=A0A5C4LZ57_9PSEU|nr:alpha/beta hydrolase [Amycolatopsis alkalitolerans]TNC22493.1 alpha/beta hydrolase [Amycolatopsis alkalitolerans]
MPEIELSAGPVEYSDTGGDGPVLVLLHGLTIDGSVWRKVVPDLGEYRCVRPTLPLGSHRKPMRPDADLSMLGMALLVGEFLEKLDLRDVTLVLNDWGGAQFLISEGKADRVARLVLVACEAFDNYPPGLPGKLIVAATRAPGGLAATMKLLRFQAVRRAPGGWGWMSKQPVPREVMDGWFGPAAASPEIRRDIKKYGLSVPPRETLLEWSERLKAFDRPVLVVWAKEDKLMPREHGPRLAALFPDAKLVEVEDSYTLVPEDRPDVLIKELREFVPA